MASGYGNPSPDQIQQPALPMFGNIGQGMQGMFGGLKRGYQAGNRALHPYSNRLLLTGMGLLSGRDGMANAMKGMIAGSALDTEDADRTKLNKALQDLMSSESDLIPDDPAIRGLMVNDPKFAEATLLQRMKPADIGEKYQGYLNAKAEGYTGDWMKYQQDTKAAGFTIQTGQLPAELGGKLGLAKLFIDELNVGSGDASLRERIKTTFGGDTLSQAKNRAMLEAGMGEPAAIWRRAESGKEALVRILTGAGMMTKEANDAIIQHGLRSTDSVKSMLDKMDWLEQELNAVAGGAVGARTGGLAKDVTEGADGGGGNLTRNDDGTLTWSP